MITVQKKLEEKIFPSYIADSNIPILLLFPNVSTVAAPRQPRRPAERQRRGAAARGLAAAGHRGPGAAAAGRRAARGRGQALGSPADVPRGGGKSAGKMLGKVGNHVEKWLKHGKLMGKMLGKFGKVMGNSWDWMNKVKAQSFLPDGKTL